MPHRYETDAAAIYRQSFAIIRAEADLARFTPEEEVVAVRMIHAAGMVELARAIRFTPGMAEAARAALAEQRGAYEADSRCAVARSRRNAWRVLVSAAAVPESLGGVRASPAVGMT